MPLSLRSDKRKSALCHDDLPLSKKIALDHQQRVLNQHVSPKYQQSKTGLKNFTSSAVLSTSSSLNQESVSDEAVLSTKKPSLGAKLSPLDLFSDDDDSDVWSVNVVRSKQENGLGKRNRHPSVDEESLLMIDEDWSGAHGNESPTIHCPGSSSKGDFQTNSNGDVVSRSSKQPSLVLEDLKKTKERKKSGYDRTLAESASSSLLYGGYMRRMASLNASACVSALMEPEKRTRPHKNILGKSQTQLRQQPRKSWSLSSSDDLSLGMPSPIMDLEHTGAANMSLSPVRSLRSSSSSSEANTSKDSDDILGATEPHEVYTLLALATLASAVNYDLDDIPYNKLGLLYNGDTIHPAARVFYNSDTDLTLPDRIIPTVVPYQKKFLMSAISGALTQRLVGKKRKGAKVSDGI